MNPENRIFSPEQYIGNNQEKHSTVQMKELLDKLIADRQFDYAHDLLRIMERVENERADW